VVAALSNKFGCRGVAMTGSLIASVFFVASSFARTVDMMLVTYGFLGGQSVPSFHRSAALPVEDINVKRGKRRSRITQ